MNHNFLETEPFFRAPEGIERGDCCYGEIVHTTAKGVFVELEDGTCCFSYEGINLPVGTKVLCTVKCLPRGMRRTLVGVDSVLHYASPSYAA